MKNTFFVFFMQKSKVWCWKPNIYDLFWDLGPTWDAWCKKTKHVRIIFGILDPPGMFGARHPTFTNYFLDFEPTWDVWCQKPNIYELFLRFGTYTWDAWCWNPFSEKMLQKHRVLHGLGAARNLKADPADPPDPPDEAEMVHGRHLGP